MPAARFGSGLNKIRKGLFSTGLKKVKAGYMYVSGAWNKVWSFGSEVSYYDGDTLIGKEDVDEGHSVLHPSLTIPQKENYTLAGWASTSGGEPLDELLATGEPMSVYAVYIPNTILIAKSYRASANDVAVDVWNTNYMSGSAYVQATSYGNQDWGNGSFSINLGRYQNSTVKIWSYWYMVDDQGYGHDEPNSPISVDGVSRKTGDVLSNISGTHTMSAFAWTNWGNGERYVRQNGGLAEVTLSNPTPWT